MSKLTAFKLIAEVVEIGSRVYGTIADKKLARENAERDEKIRALERELAEIKRRTS